MNAGLDVARVQGLLCFFITVSFRYDSEERKALLSTRDMSDAFEAFIRRLREVHGLSFEYVRVAESTSKGVVNHFHCLFRCASVPSSLSVMTRKGVGLDFYQLREMWVASSGGSQGVYVVPVDLSSRSSQASTVGYLTKYVSKSVYDESTYRWSTSRAWLPTGATLHYNGLFKSLAVQYRADCGEFHTDASRVYAPWLEWILTKLGLVVQTLDSSLYVIRDKWGFGRP